MSDRNYWTSLRQRKISRRTMLGASAKAGVGAAGLALVGCGDDDEAGDAVAAGAAAAERAAAAAEEAAAAAVAAGEARAADSEAAAAVAAESAAAAADAADAAGEASAAASQAASAADAAAALAAEAAESEDAANAAAAAEAAAAAAADAAAAASAAGDQAAAAVAAAASEAAEAAAQAARDAAAAVEAGTATAEAAQAAIDAAAEAAAAAAAAAGEASAAAGQAAATAQETAASAEAVAEAAAETAAAAVAAAEEAADAAQEAAESAAMAAAEPEGPAPGSTDFDATVRIVVPTVFGGIDWQGRGGGGTQSAMHFDLLMQWDQFTRELVESAGSMEWVSDDYTEALAHLKPGMTWHDGASVTAADVKFSFDRTAGIGLYNPDGTFDSGATYKTNAVAGEITVVDELTTRVPMSPDASAFALIGSDLPLVPKHVIEEIGDQAYNNFAVASGPFKLVSYDPSGHATSIPFADYHVETGSTHRKHKPAMKKFQQIARPEPLSRVAALEADEADMALSLPPDLAETFLDSDDFSVLTTGGVDNWNVSFNTLRPLADGSTPFQDIRVRRAINHAVNWDAIIDNLLTGREKRAYGIASGAQGAMTDEQKAERTYEYNPDKARSLLAEAGYPDGFHTPFWVHKGYLAGTEDGGLAIAQDLEKIGITTDFQADVHSIFRPRLGSIGDDGIHELPGMHFYFINHFPDPVGNINSHMDDSGSIAHGRYPDTNLQELIEAQRTEFDPAERAKRINDLAVGIYENASFLFGVEPVSLGVLRNNLEWVNFGHRQDWFNYWGIRPMVT